MPVHPTTERIHELATDEDRGPVVMVNLMRFKDQADGIDEGVSGAEAFARYSAAAMPLLEEVGGRILSAVRPKQLVIGPPEGQWDLIVLVEYPSRKSFLELVTDPDYLKLHAHREAALADSRLIACSTVDPEDLAELY